MGRIVNFHEFSQIRTVTEQNIDSIVQRVFQFALAGNIPVRNTVIWCYSVFFQSENTTSKFQIIKMFRIAENGPLRVY